MIDLRSDTATKPTAGMYEAMITAELGDDMLGEDPTVNRLQEIVCELTGKEAAIFACSGTQSNQMAVHAHCQPGDELLIEASCHITNFEGGAPAVLSGVSCRTIPGDNGKLDVEHLEDQIHVNNPHLSPTQLICLENTTNLGGGQSYSLEQIDRVGKWAQGKNVPVHLDGARLFNATVSQGYAVSRVLQEIDTVSICFSKGLGCPMGSILAGPKEIIDRAKRARKLFGGALRQGGVIAGAAIYALENHVERLAEDHANAKLFAEEIAKIDGIVVHPDAIETNLVFFHLAPEAGTAARLVKELRDRGVGIIAMGKDWLRACTHLDVSRDDLLAAINAMKEAIP